VGVARADPVRLGRQTPRVHWAIAALDRLRELDLKTGDPPHPIFVPLSMEAQFSLERLAQDMQFRQQSTAPLLRSALGKARGQALRLSLVLELLWWCGEQGIAAPPTSIGPRAFAAAEVLMTEYFLPMAARAYDNAQPTACERNAAVLARWIVSTWPEDLHPRHLQRAVRLPGLRTAEQIQGAAQLLVAAGWLSRAAPSVRFGPRARVSYTVSPRLRAQTGF